MTPLVSIIVPSYNYAHFLPETLKSLQRQQFTNWECLVVDDGSTDETAEVMKRFRQQDPRFIYIYQDNAGQSVARNAGVNAACGQYIQFLDADDWLEPQKLAVHVEWLETHATTDIAYGKSRYFETGCENRLLASRWGDPAEEWMPLLSGKGEFIVRAMAEKPILEMGCGLFRWTAIEMAGQFDPRLVGAEDYFFCFRAAAAGMSWQFIDAPATNLLVRHHAGSHSKNKLNSYRKELETRLKMRAILTELGDREAAAINEDRYAWRLRRLQDVLIDQTIKSGGKMPLKEDLAWVFHHSNWRQNAYFFPRIAKAILFHPANSGHKRPPFLQPKIAAGQDQPQETAHERI